MVMLVLQHWLTCVTLAHDEVHKTDYILQVHCRYHVMLIPSFLVETWGALKHLVKLLKPFQPIDIKYITII